MKHFPIALLCFILSLNAHAQKPEAVFIRASKTPEIDAEIDIVWNEANVYPIDKPFLNEVPTVDGSSWRALWDQEGIYILVEAKDDYWLPDYLDSPPGVYTWAYDHPEIYFDVNFTLEDGRGAGQMGSGHFMVAPSAQAGMNDGRVLSCGFSGMDEGDIAYSMKVSGSDVKYEYFIPMELLIDDEGDRIDLTATIGFDVTLVDRDPADPDRKRAVWSNDGAIDESWNNMDDCGLVTFTPIEEPIDIQSINLQDTEITENNGRVQIISNILPVNATNTKLSWRVQNETGGAKIDDEGLLTGIMDGTVMVIASATDGTRIEDTCLVYISNQLVSFGEINLIKNWVFDHVNTDGTATSWDEWIDGGYTTTQVLNGVATLDPSVKTEYPSYWHYMFFQNELQALPGVEYEFGFVAWAEQNVDLPVNFEDIGANNYDRYGATSSPWSPDGRSEWHVPITTSPAKYTMYVTFDRILPNTVQKVQFMPGLLNDEVYLDSVYLVRPEDLALITDYTAIESISLSGETEILVGTTTQFSAEVLPLDALLGEVKWSIINESGEAVIDQTGLMTAHKEGRVTVLAAARDDSKEYDTLNITILGCDMTDQIEFDSIVTDLACYDSNDGSIDISVSGPNGPFSYEWSNGADTEDLANIPGGHYELVIRDVNYCTYKTSFDLSQPGELLIESLEITPPNCANEESAKVSLSMSGGSAPYMVNINHGRCILDGDGFCDSLPSGELLIEITDASACTIIKNYIIPEPSRIDIQLIQSDMICYGAQTGFITSTVTGGNPPYVFSWNNGENIKDIEGLGAGIYTLTVSDDHSCTWQASTEILEYNNLLTSDITGLKVVPEADIAVYAVSQTSGSVFNWSLTGGNLISGQGSNLITVQWGDEGTGTISVIETNAGSCTGDPVTIDVQIESANGVQENSSQLFSIYPNPGSNQIKIETGRSDRYMIELTSLNGKSIFKGTLEGPSQQFDISSYPRGVYFITLRTKDQIATRKLFKL